MLPIGVARGLILTHTVRVDRTSKVLSTVDTFPKLLLTVRDTVCVHLSLKLYVPIDQSF